MVLTPAVRAGAGRRLSGIEGETAGVRFKVDLGVTTDRYTFNVIDQTAYVEISMGQSVRLVARTRADAYA